jgi:hypothetical protein
MEKPLEFKNTREFNITGRGKVICINFKENGYEGLRNKDLRDLFMGKEVLYEEKLYTIRGIEILGWPDRETKEGGFLIKPL